MKYLSVCSGIEAASVAFQPYGWKPVAFSEIDKFASNLLHHRYPETPNWGDMELFKEWPDADVDVLCGGTPCQSFSVAGLRQGLADPRGNLMLTFGAIARRYGPRWVVWENVPGVLSSNGGRDFAAFLGLLGQLGYGWAYRVLDAQYVRTRRFPFAVPQRRRRVFVVGYFGDWRRAAAVLFDRESLSGHPPPRREAGQGAAPTLAVRTRGGGGLGTDFDCDGGLITSNSGDVGYCLTASAQQSLDAETETLIAVAHALRGEGFDASEDGTGRGTPLVPVAIQERAVSENPENGPQGAGFRQDGAAYTLEARNKVRAVAFAENQRGEVRTSDIAMQLTTGGGKAGQGYPAVAFDLRGREGGAMPEGPHDTANMRAASGGSSRSYLAMPWAVRRLTPRECEALQGFPPNYTLIPGASKGGWRDVDETEDVEELRAAGMPVKLKGNVWRVKDPDGHRYKALGNSWAINCVDWIAERMTIVDGWHDAR